MTMREDVKDLAQEIADDLDAAECGGNNWQPEPGEKIVGRLQQISDFEGEYGTTKVLKLQDVKTGRVTQVWLNHMMLRDSIFALDPQPGDLIGIKYFGKRDSKTRKHKDGTPKQYHTYEVRIRRRSTTDKTEEGVPF